MLLLFAIAQGIALVVVIARLLPGRTRRPAVAPRSDGPADAISIIVPTLNEAHRIAPCLDGLRAQGSVVREILVVDSGSSDGTQDLVLAAAALDPRVRLLHDEPLPRGWVGKVWALQHGLRHARSPWVLGVDADTAPSPGLAGGALAAALEHEYDVVSFAPRFRIDSPMERWLQPALLVTLVYRFGAAGTDTPGDRVMANGQCFLARRRVLESVGGYAGARESFCDDVTLARQIAAAGHRVGFLDGSRLYDVRAYRGAREMWREWGRSLDLKDAASAMRQWGDVALLAMAQGTPLLGLACALVAGLGGPSQAQAGGLDGARALLVTSAALLAVRVMLLPALAPSYERRGVPFWCSPLADPLAALRILLSTVRRPTTWRGREYDLADASA